MRGRKPAPIKLKILNGNPGKRKIPTDLVKVEERIPDCPVELEGAAKDEWDRVTKELHAIGIIGAPDGPAIASYCASFGWFADAQAKIQRFGLVLVDKEKGTVKISPYFKIAEKAMQQMRASMIEFGMTPSSRARLRTGNKEETGNQLEEFLKRG
ncbi:MAG TPA: phage terminase small subunit P27 family [Caulifigura sp.]|nr:phage terminase small subunit P27 family [Caulifigura sp.]